ncbi:MAG: ATP-binding protein, partial [Cyanobacteria bacterium P01_A01_bin.84]
KIKKQHENETHTTVQFSVSDTGIDMSQEDLRSIFQEFKQANASIRGKYGGTGLGLSISYQLVKLLGGDLQVESKVNEGTKFTFSLKLLKTNENPINTNENVPPKSVLNSGSHILVVEDNELNRKYISSLLEKWGLSYDYCKNGVEATIKKYAPRRPQLLTLLDPH